MKKITILFFSIAISQLSYGQLSVTPFAGISSTRMKESFGYIKGGNYGLTGVEIEFRKKPKTHRIFYVTAVTGVTYLSNGFYESNSFSLSSFFYTQRTMNLKTRYVQVPVELKFNWQPFPLVEDWKVFLGIGISNDFLIRAHLEEQSTEVEYDGSQPSPPPYTVHYEDSRDITDMMGKYLLFGRVESGMIIKRVHFAWRLHLSFSDMYPAGLEDDWKLPDEDSPFISNYEETGKVKLKYVELVLGYRFSRN
jgi:hypothetical protein